MTDVGDSFVSWWRWSRRFGPWWSRDVKTWMLLTRLHAAYYNAKHGMKIPDEEPGAAKGDGNDR